MTSGTKIKWLLRLGLPLAGFAIALICGRTVSGAFGILFLTALFIVVLVAIPFSFVGIVFFPVLQLYGLKFSSRTEPEMNLKDPDTKLYLALGIPASLAAVALLSLYFAAR